MCVSAWDASACGREQGASCDGSVIVFYRWYVCRRGTKVRNSALVDLPGVESLVCEDES
jgi:hypothetical protein